MCKKCKSTEETTKEEAKDTGKVVKEKAGEVKETVNEAKDKEKEKAKEKVKKVKDTAKAKEGVTEVAKEAKEGLKETTDEAAAKTDKIKDKIKEATDEIKEKAREAAKRLSQRAMEVVEEMPEMLLRELLPQIFKKLPETAKSLLPEKLRQKTEGTSGEVTKQFPEQARTILKEAVAKIKWEDLTTPPGIYYLEGALTSTGVLALSSVAFYTIYDWEASKLRKYKQVLRFIRIVYLLFRFVLGPRKIKTLKLMFKQPIESAESKTTKIAIQSTLAATGVASLAAATGLLLYQMSKETKSKKSS